MVRLLTPLLAVTLQHGLPHWISTIHHATPSSVPKIVLRVFITKSDVHQPELLGGDGECRQCVWDCKPRAEEYIRHLSHFETDPAVISGELSLGTQYTLAHCTPTFLPVASPHLITLHSTCHSHQPEKEQGPGWIPSVHQRQYGSSIKLSIWLENQPG